MEFYGFFKDFYGVGMGLKTPFFPKKIQEFQDFGAPSKFQNQFQEIWEQKREKLRFKWDFRAIPTPKIPPNPPKSRNSPQNSLPKIPEFWAQKFPAGFGSKNPKKWEKTHLELLHFLIFSLFSLKNS